LRRADARQLRYAANGLEDRRQLRGELEGVTVGRGDDRRAAASLLRLGRRRQEVVGLVAGSLGDGEAAGTAELGQQRQLLEQGGVEVAAALVAGEGSVPIGWLVERVPGHDHGARPFRLPEAKQHVREPDDRPRRSTADARDRLRERVVGAVSERVAVDGEQRAHRLSYRASIAVISRWVAVAAASLGGRPARSSTGIGSP